ncbi:hypothetical protein EU546_03890, partial [Candidatus Thorarchaeota archaeon]
MIESAVLFDVLGSKVLATLEFSRVKDLDQLQELVIREYYNAVQAGSADARIDSQLDERAVSILKVDDTTLLVVVSSDIEPSPDDMEKAVALHELSRQNVESSSAREFKSEFKRLARSILQTKLRVCFVTNPDLSEKDFSGSAVEMLLKSSPEESAFSKHVAMGPYLVQAMQTDYRTIELEEWSDDLSGIDMFALVASEPLPASDRIEESILRIRSQSESPVLVVPGSDDELEFARAVESSYGVDLCDSVSPKPTHLLLAVLAMSGYSEYHPELAYDQWVIDTSIDELPAAPKREREEMGHQAFFVVDRRTGNAIYSYYYEEKSSLLEMAPNIVAAITSFKIDQTRPTETSVFRTGDLSYITIERDSYVFTLVTGRHGGVETLRERFSFLPDLFKDEVPDPMEDPIDLFRSPPFTLKLLATLPPVELAGRIAPTPRRALIWERFEHDQVGDFLEAVWQRLDGELTMSKLAPGKGPEIILGAIHLLKRLNAIEFKLKISPNDVPTILNRPNQEVLQLYENLEDILEYVDGELS